MIETEDKKFFIPGDLVVSNKLKNAPEMYVLRKKELTIKGGENKTLQGIVCRYLDKQGVFHDEIFSTKDLKKL